MSTRHNSYHNHVETKPFEKSPIVLTARGERLARIGRKAFQATGVGGAVLLTAVAGHNMLASASPDDTQPVQKTASVHAELSKKHIEVTAKPGDTLGSLVLDHTVVSGAADIPKYVRFDATVDSTVELNKDGALADGILQDGESVVLAAKSDVEHADN